MCTRTILIVAPSILITIVAIFMSLDSFEPYRHQLWNRLPFNLFDGLKKNVESANHDIVLSKKELAMYDGRQEGKGIYLAIFGKVFDVSAGSSHYGPGGGYSFFAGRDATRAFVSGDFTEAGLVDSISGLSTKDLVGIEEWVNFFYKKYIYIGKVEGNFYSADGQPTEALSDGLKLIEKGHEDMREDDDDLKKFPHCNSAWTRSTGTQIWCSDKSGGIVRNWVGVPRQYFRPGSSSSRCVCVRTTGPPSDDMQSTKNRGDLDSPHLKEYRECEPMATLCHLS